MSFTVVTLLGLSLLYFNIVNNFFRKLDCILSLQIIWV
jgi:hypothetical protein